MILDQINEFDISLGEFLLLRVKHDPCVAMRSLQMSYPLQEMTPELAEVLMTHLGYQGGPR